MRELVLLLSYDLGEPERPSSYARVKEFIEKEAISSIRPLYSQWFIETNGSPQAWLDTMRENGLIDDNDRLFICPVTKPHQGWLHKASWAWLEARV